MDVMRWCLNKQKEQEKLAADARLSQEPEALKSSWKEHVDALARLPDPVIERHDPPFIVQDVPCGGDTFQAMLRNQIELQKVADRHWALRRKRDDERRETL